MKWFKQYSVPIAQLNIISCCTHDWQKRLPLDNLRPFKLEAVPEQAKYIAA